MERETIIIDVQINADEVAKNLSKTTAEIARLKKEQKELSQFIKAGTDVNGELSAQYAVNAQRLRELTAEEKTYTAQLNTTTAEQREYGDSVYQLSAMLADLKNQYRGLSKEDREGAAGVQLKKRIQELDKEVKGLDADLGDHQRNLGNYVSALTGLDSRVVKVAAVFQGGFKQGIQAAGAAIKSFGKALLTTPLGWIAAAVAAVVAVFNKLREAFKRNDDASTALSKSFAILQPIITAITKSFDFLASAVVSVVEWLSELAKSIASLIPGYEDASNAAQDYVQALDDLEEAEREYVINHADRENQIANLNKEAQTTYKNDLNTKIKYYKEINRLEEEDLKEKVKNAKKRYELLQVEQQQNSDYSDEMKDKLTSAYAAVIQANTDYVNGTLRNSKRLQDAIDDLARKRKEDYENYKRWVNEAVKVGESAVKEYYNLYVETIENARVREEASIRLNYQWQIEELKKRLEEEEHLVGKAREYVEKTIVLLEQKQEKEISELREQYRREQAKSELEEWEKVEDIKYSLLTDRIEAERKIAIASTERQIAELRKRLEEEENLTESAKLAINEQIKLLELKLQAQLGEIGKKELKKRLENEENERVNSLEKSLLQVYDNAAKEASIKEKYAEDYYARLLEMDSETKAAMYESEDDYTAAVLAAQRQLYEARKASSDALKSQAEEIGSTLQQVTSSITSIYESVAGDTVEYENFKKAMAVVDAMISLGQSIAAATAISIEGDPYTVAMRIATNVAAVTAQFATLIATIKSATVPTAPKFAQGGIVEGASLTGDRVHVMANTGEMIINREDQRKLFDMIKAGGIGDYSLMRAAFAEALREMPSPVLDYSEFTGFQRSVKMVEKRTKLI